MEKVFLPFEGGLKIQVPDSLELITPYVIREQGDWFEDEIKFLRRILQQGEKIIDIGANYGTYTLMMAKAVGPEGKIWAFEPASSTAECLRASISQNSLTNVVVEQSALSSKPGSARLSLNANSELNSIVKGNASVASEEVPVVTLDERMVKYSWRGISFMKIDAEGEEENIIAGGKKFFDAESPLIEFEYKAGMEVNEGLVEAFGKMGFQSYRLVPGLDVLIPFPPGSVADGYLLNLFCCKKDRALELHKRGLLVQSEELQEARNREIPLQSHHHWRMGMQEFEWASGLMPLWEESLKNGPEEELERALNLYFFSRDRKQSHISRVVALERSMQILKALIANPLYLRESTFARVAREFGARQDAVKALNALATRILTTKQVNPREPFLLPLEPIDCKGVDSNHGNTIFAATLEGLEVFSAFSSFYTGQSSRGRLEVISKLGLGSPEMCRRLNLLNKRFPK
jgi:protein O-GlcNAc transferase